jgi:rubrerythrin
MNLERMLEKCERGQWSVDDLDWSVTPKDMSREDEIAIVQYFMDMSGIERLAKALFEEQRRRCTDPTLCKIFDSFVVDEERHAVAAERLANHYNVHKYRDYQLSESLVRFQPHFLAALRNFSEEVANAYILAGELILDVALLRSLNDHVDDDMSHQAMRLINRDESRHIAIDYHMAEYYASDAYQERLDAAPRKTLREHRTTMQSVLTMMYYAAPFFRDVFLQPMSVVDPDGVRMREAFKRIHIISNKPGVKRRPFAKFMISMQGAYGNPMVRNLLGPVIERVVGVPGNLLNRLYTEEEIARAGRMSFDELAEEALASKNMN